MEFTREQAIKIIISMADKDDPFWEWLFEDYMPEDYIDSDEDVELPTMDDVLRPFGVTSEEILVAEGFGPK